MRSLRLGSLFAGIGGFDRGFERAGWETIWQVEIETFCQAVLVRRFPKAKKYFDIRSCRGSIASAQAFPARMSRLQANARGSRMGSALGSFMILQESCATFDPLGLSSKMFPDFSVRTKAETLQKFSAFSWSNAGMGFNGVCSTVDIGESHRDAVECSLSDILESRVPQRFFLSPRAAAGILRRAAKRGQLLPERRRLALTALACADASLEAPQATRSAETATEKQISSSPQPSPVAATPLAEGGNTISTSSSSKTAGGGGKKGSTELASKKAGQATPSQQLTGTLWPITSSDRDSKDEITPMNPKGPVQSSTKEITPAGMKPERLLLVRRLTPTECEVLQAFPKGWTVPAIGRSAMRSRSRSRNGSQKEL